MYVYRSTYIYIYISLSVHRIISIIIIVIIIAHGQFEQINMEISKSYASILLDKAKYGHISYAQPFLASTLCEDACRSFTPRSVEEL